MKQVAIYGKGGIGKSTLCSNLSAALALAGSRVLQVGCDPKQDSTRLLLGGRSLPTVLDYLRRTRPAERQLPDVMAQGFAGVACVEAGGPEPGVGCAGRGILSAFELLEQLGVQGLGFDLALYDVLGDVVCGGFAVPLREAYADRILIVTSGEFMALYAANNILRGVRNFEGRGPRLGGILMNRRGLEGETERVQRFAAAVGLPILIDLPRDPGFAQAEQRGATLLELFPDLELARRFRALAGRIREDLPVHAARPLDPDQLEAMVLGRKVASVPSSPAQACTPPAAPAEPPPRRYWSKSVRRQEVLHGCAYNAAVHVALQVDGALTLVHGPRSCAYISQSGAAASARRTWRRTGTWQQASLEPSLACTAMDERAAIFGGMDALAEGLREAAAARPEALFVATTCSSGIIGDDLDRSLALHRDLLGDLPVVPLRTDGNLTGDYMQGILDAAVAIVTRLIDRQAAPEPGWVNIVGEKNLATNAESNFLTVKAMLDALGLRVNCRFIRATRVEAIRGLRRAPLNLLAHEDAMGRGLRDFLVDHCAARFLPGGFPVGFEGTARWLRALAAAAGCGARAEALVTRERGRYEAGLAALRPRLAGRSLMLVTPNHQIDWVLELAGDLGMEVVLAGILESAWDEDFHSRFEGKVPIRQHYGRDDRDRDILALRPDLTLANTLWPGQPKDCKVERLPYCPDVGFQAGLWEARRWSRALALPAKEGWRDDLPM
jgi:nitrogenase iron protein